MTIAHVDRCSPTLRANPAAAPIAVVISRFPLLTETFILREIIEMERQGQPVRLVPMLKMSPRVIHEEAKPWNLRALYTPYLSVEIAASNGRTLLRSPLRYLRLCFRLFFGTLLRPATFLKTFALFPKSVLIAEQLHREGIRHIHAHYATFPATIALIVAWLSDLTFSFTVHAHDIQVDRSLLRWKLREARFVRSISEFNKRFLERMYPAEAAGKIEVIRVGVDLQTYEECAARFANIPREVPRVLCVAAHKPYKGLPVLVEACRILKNEGICFRCQVIGDGPMRRQLERMIVDTGNENVIALLGPKAQHEVARAMAESRFFVLPSIIAPDGQTEGIPVSLMEAMASGRAVVSTALSGIPELVEHGVSGLLVPPGDPIALAGAMRHLFDHQELANAMGARGAKKVRNDFAIDRCVAQLLARLRRENKRGSALSDTAGQLEAAFTGV